MEALIHFNELQSWQARHNAGEIYIGGMAVLTEKGCYRLAFVETPGMKPLNNLEREGNGVEAEACQSKKFSRAINPGEQASGNVSDEGSNPSALATLPPPIVLVTCPDCTAQHPEGEECGICSRFSKIAVKAAANRRAWHLFKRGEGPRPI